MTETEARQVLLLQSREAAAAPHWSAEDRAWATRQAVAAVGDGAEPERFVVARAALALQRLLPRDAAARRWLEHRGWHPAWLVLAALLGLMAGLAIDQLGPPNRVNLLAPAVWAVVAWNLVVYTALLLPWPTGGLRRTLAGLGRRVDAGAAALWAQQAAPLTLARAAAVLHLAAAALALGLVAGLYLRGLVLDYRAGWQSTFLDAAAVQSLLQVLLAPATALTGIALPDVAPLRVAPDGVASASAAPWIHLYAATLVLFVVVPRALLAGAAGLRARRLAQHFPLALDTPYFAALHPLMQPDRSRVLRLLWLAPADLPPVTLLGTALAALPAPLTLLTSDEGDELQLVPAPERPTVPMPAPWWGRWGSADAAAAQWQRLRGETDAVLHVRAAGETPPPWLAALQRPVLVLQDSPAPEPPALPLRRLADGWLADERWLRQLETLLDGDARVQRLAATWRARQQALLDATAAELATSLGLMATARVPLADDGLRARRNAAEGAQQALADALEAAWRASGERLAALRGAAPADTASTAGALPAAAVLRQRVSEGPAAMVGGVVSGALAGLKADVLSGGLTMGAGMLAGGVLGALAAAGVARGVNVVRGTDRSFVTWDAAALTALADSALLRALVQVYGEDAAAARAALDAARAAQRAAASALEASWAGRSPRLDNAGEAERLAAVLRPPLATLLREARAELHRRAGVHNPPA